MDRQAVTWHWQLTSLDVAAAAALLRILRHVDDVVVDVDVLLLLLLPSSDKNGSTACYRKVQ
jgi:hypothetical protein